MTLICMTPGSLPLAPPMPQQPSSAAPAPLHHLQSAALARIIVTLPSVSRPASLQVCPEACLCDRLALRGSFRMAALQYIWPLAWRTAPMHTSCCSGSCRLLVQQCAHQQCPSCCAASAAATCVHDIACSSGATCTAGIWVCLLWALPPHAAATAAGAVHRKACCARAEMDLPCLLS